MKVIEWSTHLVESVRGSFENDVPYEEIIFVFQANWAANLIILLDL
jgi:hypothetical protein